MVLLHKRVSPGRTGLSGLPAKRAFTNESDDVTTFKKEERLIELPMMFVADTTRFKKIRVNYTNISRNTEVAREEPLVSTGTAQTTTEPILKQKTTILAIDGISSRKMIIICLPIQFTTISAEIRTMLKVLGAMSTEPLNSVKSRLAMRLKL